MTAFYLAVAIFIILFLFLYCQNNIIDVTKYRLHSNDVNSEIKIVQLSDLHSKPFGKVIELTEKQAPDIIVITGDYINDKCRNKNKMLQFGIELLNIAPVYYITGNHERRLDNFDELMGELKNIGFTVLLNEIVTTDINGSTVNILGLDENQADFEDYKARKNGTFQYQDMSGYFNSLAKLNGFKLVLSHFPENYKAVTENNYSQYDFDLQLSGHAHGGQFILPIIGPVFSPGQGIRPKYARGSFGDRPKLIVSRGLGNAEFPFRLFNHPQINVISISKD
ncbi:MAG: metallophosphoesterase [Eubacteriales bacterium]|nr:metallophosphoesterase [Eubacteriales bacterium]